MKLGISHDVLLHTDAIRQILAVGPCAFDPVDSPDLWDRVNSDADPSLSTRKFALEVMLGISYGVLLQTNAILHILAAEKEKSGVND